MKITAEANQINVSTRKVRIVADEIRGMSLDDALVALSFTRKRAAGPIKKVIESAIANAVNNANLKKESLALSAIEVNEGVSFKRFRPSTRGRVHPYKKRTSHIRVILEDSIKDKTENVKEEDAKSS
jgi:large subunit ribosomal protein L22